MSGVAPMAVMMKPFMCPGQCIYCPLEIGMPKSYLSDEPAAQRAKQLDFDPYRQVEMRLKQFELTGHNTDKVEVIVIGGTFSAYEKEYKKWFITEIYRALNDYSSSLRGVSDEAIQYPDGLPREYARNDRDIDEITRNEKAKNRVVALSVETRPDWVTEDEVKLIRSLGVTKVQLGVQAIDDEIAKITKRGHGIKEVREATRSLRNAGIKICYHIMPNLPGSNPEKDIEMNRLIYSDPGLKPDYVKIYPCMVIPQTALHKMWLKGEFKPYDDETLKRVLKEISADTPEYVRIDRLVRDISRKWVAGGSIKSNMRQEVEAELIKEGRPCRCVRCREIRNGEYRTQELKNSRIIYETQGGEENFLSIEGEGKLMALLRLRLPERSEKMLFKELEGAAIVREIHSFGEVVGIRLENSKKEKFEAPKKVQHRGLGKKLMQEAEKIARERGYGRLAVISAIGTREYYRKLGFVLDGSYMIKELC
jgi:elongator complex protein 3